MEPCCQSSVESFYPRSYDLNQPSEKADMIADFRRSAALTILNATLNLAASGWQLNEALIRLAVVAVKHWLFDFEGRIIEEKEALQVLSDSQWSSILSYSEYMWSLEAGGLSRHRKASDHTTWQEFKLYVSSWVSSVKPELLQEIESVDVINEKALGTIRTFR